MHVALRGGQNLLAWGKIGQKDVFFSLKSIEEVHGICKSSLGGADMFLAPERDLGLGTLFHTYHCVSHTGGIHTKGIIRNSQNSIFSILVT